MAGWKTVASIYSRVGNLKSATSLSKSPFFLLLLFSFLKNKRENSWGSNSPMLKYTVGSCSGIQRESLDLLGAICFIITEFGSQLCPLPCLPSLLLQEQPQWAGDTWRYIKRDVGNGKRPCNQISRSCQQSELYPQTIWDMWKHGPNPFLLNIQLFSSQSPFQTHLQEAKPITWWTEQAWSASLPFRCNALQRKTLRIKHCNEGIDLKTCFCGGW